MASLFSFALACFIRKVKATTGSAKARGWGDDIKWVTLDEGRRQASAQSKPLMLLIHRATCPSCLALKRKFSSSDQVASLSRLFVMVNLETLEVPHTRDFEPDGDYVPRILFFSPSGTLMWDVRYKDGKEMFYYPDAESVTRPEGYGLSEEVDWMTLEEGQLKAAEEYKPLMLIVHTMPCAACKQFRRWFNNSGQMSSLGQKFVMVNLLNREVPLKKDFMPDGRYVPRVLFFDPKGQLMRDVTSGDSKFHYNYPSVASLAANMETVLKRIEALRSPYEGWGDSFDWMTLEEGQLTAGRDNKPMMVVVHKMSCPACQYFKGLFSRSGEISGLSGSFVLVNLLNTEVPFRIDYMPDGQYVPRVLFFDPKGQLMRDVKHHEGKDKYNYPDVPSLVTNMKLVLSPTPTKGLPRVSS